MRFLSALLVLAVSTLYFQSGSSSIVSPLVIAQPTPEQLAWAREEIGVLIHFNMETFMDDGGCADNTEVGPHPTTFNPYRLNTNQWVQSMKDLGAKYAVLVAKHNCGFATWPTQVSIPDLQFTYNYSVQYSGNPKMDVVGSFLYSCSANGIKTGYYYSDSVNSFLNVRDGQVRARWYCLLAGNVSLTADIFTLTCVAFTGAKQHSPRPG